MDALIWHAGINVGKRVIMLIRLKGDYIVSNSEAYLAIIPRAHVGYQMIDIQNVAPSWL